jgi:DNA-binding PadR family transcriptional regulator
VREKDQDFDKKRAEVLNFIDGKRSVYQIAKSVSAEYSEIDPERVLKFLRDLEKAKLVQLT